MDSISQIDRRSFCTLAAAGGAAVAVAPGVLGATAAVAEEASGAAGEAGEFPPQYIVEIITPRIGDAQAVYEEYLELCAPCFEEGGAKLLHALVDPMMWLHHDYNNLVFMWQVDGGPRGMWEAGRHWTPEAAQWRTGLRGRCKNVIWYKLATPEGIEELDRVSYDILD